MHDLRRRALESGKKPSRKAQSKLSSLSPSASGSRTHSRTASRHGSDEEDIDELSDGTNWSTNSIDDMIAAEPDDESGDFWKSDLHDRIEEIIDRKRSSIQGRELCLMRYMHHLMSRYAYNEINPKVSELMPALLKSVKAESSEKETTLALKAIALTLITVPSDTAYEPLYTALKRCYTTSESNAVKAAAIHTLGAAAMYGGAAETEMGDLMDELIFIIESDGTSIEAEDSVEVVTAACEEWGYLATSIEDLEDRTEDAMDAFVEQLESGDTSVQVAAGENIALLYEKSYTAREADDDPASEEEDEHGVPIDTSVVKRYEVYRQSNQLKHTLSSLANESSKNIAKKDRKILHANFNDILGTVEHPYKGPRYSNALDKDTNRPYGSRMKVHVHRHGYMTIDKWWKLIRLAELRRILGAGFVVHYEHNEVVFDTLPVVMSAT